MTMRFSKMLYTGVYTRRFCVRMCRYAYKSVGMCVLREGFSFGYYLVEIKRRLPEKRTKYLWSLFSILYNAEMKNCVTLGTPFD